MWTDAVDVELAKLWHAGTHTKDIAKQIGAVSGSAVIGRAARLGLGPHPTKHADSTMRLRVERRKLERKRSPKVRLGKFTMEKPEPVASLDVPFLETRPGQCKAITDATRFAQKCCGQPSGENTYCTWHTALYYGKGAAR